MFFHASRHCQAELPSKPLTCGGTTSEFLCPPRTPPPGWEGWPSYSRVCCLMLGWKVTACKLERAAGRCLVPASPSRQSRPAGLLTELPRAPELCGTPEPLSRASPGAPARDWSVRKGRAVPAHTPLAEGWQDLALQSNGGRSSDLHLQFLLWARG